jgi:hypothetical protein
LFNRIHQRQRPDLEIAALAEKIGQHQSPLFGSDRRS